MAKKQDQTRRQLIEQMQRDQASANRRRTVAIVAMSVVIALAIIAYPAIKLVQDAQARSTAVAELGVAAAQASCGEVIEDKTTGNRDHKPDGTAITYAMSPPSSGSHYPSPAPFARKFYTVADRPTIGNLVHNLEHGYTILWYNDAVAGDQTKVDAIERLAKTFSTTGLAGKFIAAPYTAKDGGPAWPAGKNIAFSHWGGGNVSAQRGHRQFCGEVSGEALKQFMDKYPATDAPEPNAG
jgi:hypothetical protein